MADMTLVEVINTLQNNDKVEGMFERWWWPDGVRCPGDGCGADNITRQEARKQPYRCRACRKEFSVRTNSIMHGSNLSYSQWAIAMYLLSDNNKGISSVRLAEQIGVTRKTAWFLAHRIREAWESDNQDFRGPVEVDETYVGGADKNRHWKNRLWLHTLGARTLVIGMKDRATGRVKTSVLSSANHVGITQFVHANLKDIMFTEVYTDGHSAYEKLKTFYHEAVNHSRKEYVKGEDIHTNGIEAFWSMIKRGIMGTYHYISPKHTHRYATEFEGRHNARASGLSAMGKLKEIVVGMVSKRLTWKKLVGRPGHAASWQPGLSRLVDRVFGGGTYFQREKEIREGAFVTNWKTGRPNERQSKLRL